MNCGVVLPTKFILHIFQYSWTVKHAVSCSNQLYVLSVFPIYLFYSFIHLTASFTFFPSIEQMVWKLKLSIGFFVVAAKTMGWDDVEREVERWQIWCRLSFHWMTCCRQNVAHTSILYFKSICIIILIESLFVSEVILQLWLGTHAHTQTRTYIRVNINSINWEHMICIYQSLSLWNPK